MELHGAGKLFFRRGRILLIVGQHAEAFMHDGEIGIVLHGLIERGLGFAETACVDVEGTTLGFDFGGRQGAAGVVLRIAAGDGIDTRNEEAILARVGAHFVCEFLQITEGLLRRGDLIATCCPGVLKFVEQLLLAGIGIEHEVMHEDRRLGVEE